MKRIAIITGASGGLGRTFAREIAACKAERDRIDEVWLLARSAPGLEETARGCYGLPVRTIVMDLSAPDSPARLENLLKAEPDALLSLLVNNAGMGTYGTFIQTPLERQLSMIDLNVRVLTELTWRLVPVMARGSRIINVASLAAFAPLGNFAAYGASKAFVRSLSIALAAELHPRGILVHALNPGSVESGFARVASAGARQEVLHGYPAEPVVRKCLAATRRGRWESMPRLLWRLKALAGAIAGPHLSALFTARVDARPSADLLDRGPRDAPPKEV